MCGGGSRVHVLGDGNGRGGEHGQDWGGYVGGGAGEGRGGWLV